MKRIGLDAGSVGVKLVVLEKSGSIIRSAYERHKGHPLPVALDLLEKAAGTSPASLSVTGSAGRAIASALGIGFTNELVAQSYATGKIYPRIRTVFELGGEDSKLIMLGPGGIKDFSINSACAAGTGSFLDQQAERLRLSIEEFSRMAENAGSPSRIAGRCSVFAKSDMIHLQQIATPVENIVAGLCFAVARNFKGSIVRGRSIEEPVSFHGGVAANRGMVRAFREVFQLRELFVPEEHAFMGALGAALRDMDEGIVSIFELGKLRTFIGSSRFSEEGCAPLTAEDDDFSERHSRPGLPSALCCGQTTPASVHGAGDLESGTAKRTAAYLGIDIGSISTNLAVLDGEGRLLAKRYLMTAGRPIDAVRDGLEQIYSELGNSVEIMGVGTTGSGRYMIADYVGADIVKNEITAQATAAAFINPKVDTIFEIGGQDSKFISLKDGVIVDFEMNKACAAGTGSFLEEQAEKLDVSVKDEFAELAFTAGHPCRLGERCTVFMENSLMANLQKGAEKNDLLAGLSYSIVQNYINKVVCGRNIGGNIFFQGGVAFNKSVVAAFEKYLGRKVTVPPHHDVTGAIGMALIAMRHMNTHDEVKRGRGETEQRPAHRVSASPVPRSTTFKGFELSRRPYEVSSFACKGCSNVCEINRVKISGEEGHLFYGGRCEKYDVRKRNETPALPDLFAFREEALWAEHHSRHSPVGSHRSSPGNESKPALGPVRPKIGVPYIFFFHDFLPFWTTLLSELGFDVNVSPKTDREIVRTGIESVLADTCFPVKVAHGHIRKLIESGITTLFIPSFINVNDSAEEYKKGFACPLTQTIPYSARVAHREARIIAPVITIGAGDERMIAEIFRAFRGFGIRKRAIRSAVTAARRSQERFGAALMQKAGEAISSITERTLVIVGRSYNAFDPGVNLTIPKKLADLGVQALPMDFLPLESVEISKDWPNMYWRSGQRILKAARFIREHPHLYALYIGNFSCGPDSFILKFFEEEMKGKPFLHIEIDEHSADAGAITRCEAFLDSIRDRDEQRTSGRETRQTTKQDRPVPVSRRTTRTVYVPRMSDHALALAAAFQRCGVPAEVLPESDKTSVDIGRRHVSGKECYPCTVTTGDMLKKVLSRDFRPEQSAFFMPSGAGPCRFGQYNVFHRMVLDDLGHSDVPIFSPNQDVSFYQELGVVGKEFPLHAWEGIVAVEILRKCLHETRPYEEEPGSSDRLYGECLDRLYHSLRGADGNIETAIERSVGAFRNLPRRKEQRPLIGIVGEIFVRSHRFSNEDLVRKIESLGGEVWLAPVEEWIHYVNYVSLRRALGNRDRKAVFELLLKAFVQKRVEHRFGKCAEGFLKTLKEPGTRDILRKASSYLHDSFEGEAVLSIGKGVDLIKKGVSGIINAMPFGCMPGTVVTTLLRGLSKDYGTPCISISYDGSESPATEIQLEAFMNQATEYGRKRRRH